MLDKNNEIGVKVHHTHPSLFKTKYVQTILYRILVNVGKAEVVDIVMKLWLDQFEKGDGNSPSFTQIKTEIHNSVNMSQPCKEVFNWLLSSSPKL